MREYDLEVVGASSMIRFICSAVALTRMLPTLDLSWKVVEVILICVRKLNS